MWTSPVPVSMATKSAGITGTSRSSQGWRARVPASASPDTSSPVAAARPRPPSRCPARAARTGPAHGGQGAAHGERGRVEPQLLVHLMLDGQAVAVPARNVHRVLPEHGAG